MSLAHASVCRAMFGLNHGELIVVLTVVGFVLSANVWPRLGAWCALVISGKR